MSRTNETRHIEWDETCKYKCILVDECTENIDEVKIAEVIVTENICKCILYIVLFSIIFTIHVGISTYFVYYKYMNRKKENVSRYDYVSQATNY